MSSGTEGWVVSGVPVVNPGRPRRTPGNILRTGGCAPLRGTPRGSSICVGAGTTPEEKPPCFTGFLTLLPDPKKMTGGPCYGTVSGPARPRQNGAKTPRSDRHVAPAGINQNPTREFISDFPGAGFAPSSTPFVSWPSQHFAGSWPQFGDRTRLASAPAAAPEWVGIYQPLSNEGD